MPEGNHDMTPRHDDDSHVESLDRLCRLTPNPERAARVRARCRIGLERRRSRQLPAFTTIARASRLLAPAIVAGFCLLYVAALLTTTLRLEGILR